MNIMHKIFQTRSCRAIFEILENDIKIGTTDQYMFYR